MRSEKVLTDGWIIGLNERDLGERTVHSSMSQMKFDSLASRQLYNAREIGGIAKPAVLVTGSKMVVQFFSLDTVGTRVPAREIVRLLRTSGPAPALRRTLHVPGPAAVRVIRNNFSFLYVPADVQHTMGADVDPVCIGRQWARGRLITNMKCITTKEAEFPHHAS